MSKALEHKKYLREETVKNDTRQSKFNNKGDIKKSEKKINKEEKLNLDKIVYCPFCLYRANLMKFLTPDSKGGISTYKAKCPECKVGMLMKTVSAMHYMTDNKIRSYAKWVVDYRQGFWRKVNKNVWSKRLKEYQWSGIFWSEYKKLKASIPRLEEEYEYSKTKEHDYAETKEGYLKWKEEHPDE